MLKFAVAATLMAFLAVPAVAQDAAAGKTLFRRCAACHTVGENARNRAGPVLTGVVGRVAGSYKGYRYSKSMRAAGAAGLVWSPDRLFDYLKDPTGFLRSFLDDPKARSKMPIKLKNETDRRDVIAYLASFTSAVPAGTGVCIQNGSKETRLFAAESGKTREVATLKPGDTLCAAGKVDGVVSVYEGHDSFEGCSRLVPVGGREVLIYYASFDRCAWKSNAG